MRSFRGMGPAQCILVERISRSSGYKGQRQPLTALPFQEASGKMQYLPKSCSCCLGLEGTAFFWLLFESNYNAASLAMDKNVNRGRLTSR